VIDLNQYVLFLGVSLVVICTPGQDTALTIRNTLLGMRRAGIATALGVASGQATWTVCTSAGLIALVLASGAIFTVIKVAGAAYLIYLGVRSLTTIRSHGIELPTNVGSRLEASAAFRQGFVSNLSNVKMLAFFTSLLPQFAGSRPTLWLLLALGINFSVLTVAWLTGYAVAVERLGRLLRRAAVQRVMQGLLGAVLVGLGVRVGAEALQNRWPLLR
jgi:threonine/homoserine/homoserine lactone efflux protein